MRNTEIRWRSMRHCFHTNHCTSLTTQWWLKQNFRSLDWSAVQCRGNENLSQKPHRDSRRDHCRERSQNRDCAAKLWRWNWSGTSSRKWVLFQTMWSKFHDRSLSTALLKKKELLFLNETSDQSNSLVEALVVLVVTDVVARRTMWMFITIILYVIVITRCSACGGRRSS